MVSVVSDASDPLRRLVTALLTPPLGDLEPAVFQSGVAALRRYLQRRYCPPLSASDVAEIAADAVSQMYEASRRGLVLAGKNPTGYLLKIAANSALARIRRAGRDLPVDAAAGVAVLNDDPTAARLDQVATADLVQRAMRHALDQDDVTAFRVATHLLDEIQRTGTAPSNRRTAAVLALSHAGVAKALHRLRNYLTEATTG